MPLYRFKLKPQQSLVLVTPPRTILMRLRRNAPAIPKATMPPCLWACLALLAASTFFFLADTHFGRCPTTELAVKFPCRPSKVVFKEVEGLPVEDNCSCLAEPVYGRPRRISPCPAFAAGLKSGGPQDQDYCYVQEVKLQKWKVNAHKVDAEDGEVVSIEEKIRIDVVRTYAYGCATDQPVSESMVYHEEVEQTVVNKTVSARSLFFGARLSWEELIFGRGADNHY